MAQRSAIVTGAGSGIGLATVERLLSEGWHVVAGDRDEQSLKNLASAHPGTELTTAVVDITNPADVADLATVCTSGVPPLEALVNSAGIGAVVPLQETTADLMRQMYEVNVIGALAITQAVAPILTDNGGGSIVHLASVSGIQGNFGRAAYGASKGAMITLTKIMAVELAGEGIRVNAIAPGPIETALTRNSHSPATREAWESAVLLGRYGTTDEVASAASFLADGKRSSFITGQIFAVDGGFTAAGVRA